MSATNVLNLYKKEIFLYKYFELASVKINTPQLEEKYRSITTCQKYMFYYYKYIFTCFFSNNS